MAELWVWGINQSYGQLGDNTTTNRSSPVQTITGGTNWSVVSFGKNHSAAIKSDGTLWVWGLNNYGQLGDNTILNKSSPIQTISAGSDWSTVCCGQYHTVALKTDGTLWSWGNGNFSGASGILGDNSVANRSSPVQTISAGTDWASISCSDKNTAAIKKDGSLWIWGGNGYGQLGTNTSVLRVSSPIQTVAGGTNWSKISVGYGHISAIKSDGTLWLWGRNNVGQLGNNDINNTSSPIQTITYGTNWSEISSLSNTQAAIKTDGTLWLWGNAFNGQLGDNTNVNKSSPVQTISAGTNWSKVQIGASASFSIKKDGTLWSWGLNSFGTLGDNTNVQKSSPVQVFGSINNWQNLATRVDRAAAALYEPPVPYIVLQTSPQYFYDAQPFGTQPVINFYDSSNNLLTSGTYAVSASAVSGTLSLGGTTTANSSGGIAAFSNLSFTGTGTGSLLFTASGFTSVINGPLSVVPPVPVMPIRTETSGKIPTSGQLFIGELAINITDQKGYVKKSDGTIVNVFTGLYSGVIQNYMIASGAVRSGHIGDAAVVSGSIASGSVGWSAHASGAVRSGHIGDGAVVSGSVASGQIGVFHIASGVISTATLGSGQVLSGNIASGQIGINHLSSGIITTLTLGSGQVTSGSLASGSVSQFKLSSGAVNSGHIGNAAVVSGSIASGSVGQFAIASGSITAQHIASGAVVSADIADNAVISGKISSGVIAWFNLASGAVLSGHIGDAAVVSGSVASGQIGLYHLASGTVIPTNPAGSNGNLQYNLSGSFAGGAATQYNTSSGHLTITAQSGSFTPLFIRADVSQVVSLQEWQNNSGLPKSYINASGTFYGVVDGGLF